MQVPDRTDGPWPVELEVGPEGDLYYVDVHYGILHRICYTGADAADQPPTAVASASPSTGPAGTTVTFDATSSSDPEGQSLTYAGDLDGDGTLDDGTGATVRSQYADVGRVSVTLEVRDPAGNRARTTITITIGGGAPAPEIVVAAGSHRWHTGERHLHRLGAGQLRGCAVELCPVLVSTLFHCDAGTAIRTRSAAAQGTS